MEVFRWIATDVEKVEYKNPTVKADFGDGYTQIALIGIRKELQVWSIKFAKSQGVVYKDIVDFLRRHGTYSPFWWRNDLGEDLPVVCEAWSWGDDKDQTFTVSATFKEYVGVFGGVAGGVAQIDDGSGAPADPGTWRAFSGDARYSIAGKLSPSTGTAQWSPENTVYVGFVSAFVARPPINGDLQFDVLKNGTSIFDAGRPYIRAGKTASPEFVGNSAILVGGTDGTDGLTCNVIRGAGAQDLMIRVQFSL